MSEWEGESVRATGACGLKRRAPSQRRRVARGSPPSHNWLCHVLHLAVSNISPGTPKKCIRANGTGVRCLSESESPRYNHGFGLQVKLRGSRRTFLSSHRRGRKKRYWWGKVVWGRGVCTDLAEQLCLLPPRSGDHRCPRRKRKSPGQWFSLVH